MLRYGYALDTILKFCFFFFCSANLSCFMIAHIFKDKHKVAGDINSLNLLVDVVILWTNTIEQNKVAKVCDRFHQKQ